MSLPGELHRDIAKMEPGDIESMALGAKSSLFTSKAREGDQLGDRLTLSVTTSKITAR